MVAFLLREAVSLVEQTRQILRHVHVAGRILQFRQLIKLFGQRLAQPIDVETHLHQQRFDRPALLLKQRLHQMQGFDGRMVETNSNGLGIGERKLQLAGQTIDTHGCSSSCEAGRRHDSRHIRNLRDAA